MKHHWIILALILLFQSDNFISIDEQIIKFLMSVLVIFFVILIASGWRLKSTITKYILIIGGNRFMGKHLSTKLVSMNNEVDVFNRSGTGTLGANIIQGNRNNREDLEEIDIVKYDCIVDMCLYKVEQFNLMKDLIPSVPIDRAS